MKRISAAVVCLLSVGTTAFAPTSFVGLNHGKAGPFSQEMITPTSSQQRQPFTFGGVTMLTPPQSGRRKSTFVQSAPDVGPPPDLPSLLLHNRIVYIGMPLVSTVTELIIAQLLYLNYESKKRPITMYINSSGSAAPDGKAVGFETEAFAIADVMKYIGPPIHTIALGQAFGTAAMLLANGDKGHRFALPNAVILLNQPRTYVRGHATDIAIKAKEMAENRRVNCELLANACGKPVETLLEDTSRTKYLQPEEAVEYGLIDRVLDGGTTKKLAGPPSFLKHLAK